MGFFSSLISRFRRPAGPPGRTRHPPGVRAGGRKVVRASPDLLAHFAQEATWAAVASSNVDRIAYRAALRWGESPVLAVRFLSGATYFYYDAPLEVFTDMLAAASKGRFVWTDLRDRYDYEGPLPLI